MQQRLTTRTAIRDRAQREIAESGAEKYVPLSIPREPRARDLSRVTEPDDPHARYVGYATGNKDH